MPRMSYKLQCETTSDKMLLYAFRDRLPDTHIILGYQAENKEGLVTFRAQIADGVTKFRPFTHFSIGAQVISTNQWDFQTSRKRNWRSGHLLVIDDIGKKVPVPDLPPSACIETSPGNEQWWYLFDRPVFDQNEMARLVKSIADGKVSDAGADGIVRWMRLPTRAVPLGKVHHARVMEWHPDRLYAPGDDLIRSLGGTPRSLEKRSLKSLYLIEETGIVGFLQSQGLMDDTPDDNGYFPCECPREEEHSPGGSAGYNPAKDHFNCWHGHGGRRVTTNEFHDYALRLGCPDWRTPDFEEIEE